MIFIGYQKIRSDGECNYDETLIGKFSTLYECFDACLASAVCKYFIYGKGGKAQGKCYWEKIVSGDENCEEKWIDDGRYDFYKLGTLFYI